MPESAFIVAISTLVFCGLTALALIRTVSHLDLPEASAEPEQVRHEMAV